MNEYIAEIVDEMDEDWAPPIPPRKYPVLPNKGERPQRSASEASEGINETDLGKIPVSTITSYHTEEDNYRHKMIAREKSNTLTWVTLYNRHAKALMDLNDSRLIDRFGYDFKDLFDQVLDLEAEAEIGVSPKDLFGYFITISPDHNSDQLQQLQLACKRISKLSGVSDYLYCFEQKGTDEETMGTHPHAHMLVKRNADKQTGEPRRLKKQIKQTIKSSFKPNNPNVLIKAQKRGTEHVRIKYILGQKKNITPEETEFNQKWRMQNNLKQIYPDN